MYLVVPNTRSGVPIQCSALADCFTPTSKSQSTHNLRTLESCTLIFVMVYTMHSRNSLGFSAGELLILWKSKVKWQFLFQQHLRLIFFFTHSFLRSIQLMLFSCISLPQRKLKIPEINEETEPSSRPKQTLLDPRLELPLPIRERPEPFPGTLQKLVVSFQYKTVSKFTWDGQ